VEVFGYIGHVCRFDHRVFCECNFEEHFSCCMMLPRFLVDFCCSLGWMKVLGRANGVVWGFITGCFSKVVGCCAGFLLLFGGCVRAAECTGGSCFCGSL
jgi:hypothetical protein